jgi:hypothetical protein
LIFAVFKPPVWHVGKLMEISFVLSPCWLIFATGFDLILFGLFSNRPAFISPVLKIANHKTHHFQYCSSTVVPIVLCRSYQLKHVDHHPSCFPLEISLIDNLFAFSVL